MLLFEVVTFSLVAILLIHGHKCIKSTHAKAINNHMRNNWSAIETKKKSKHMHFQLPLKGSGIFFNTEVLFQPAALETDRSSLQ